MRKRLLIIFLGTLFVAILLSACAPGRASRTPAPKATAIPPVVTTASPTPSPPSEVELPFETIERADYPRGGRLYEGKEPKLVVIAEKPEIDTLGGTVSQKVVAELHNLDFERYFAIAAFQGSQPYSPAGLSGVEVQRISRKGSTVTIQARFYLPTRGQVLRPIVTSPYHLVKVERGKEVQGEMEFILNVDGKELIRQTYVLR